MATIGHTLVGLSIGGLCPAQSRTRILQFFWLGLMVLAAHLVDIAEWVLTTQSRTQYHQHFVTHSAWSTTVLVVILWAILALGARVRSPWPYLCVAVGVFSHLLLDYLPVRNFIADLYGRETPSLAIGLLQSIIAEIWLYGLFLVLVALWQAARSPGCPRPAKKLAMVLAGACVLSAVTRVVWIWAPVYALATAHGVLLLRRSIRPALLWSLVPMIPIFILLAVELVSLRYYQQALVYEDAKDLATAVRLHRKALALPARSSRVQIFVHLAACESQIHELAAAERDYLTAVKLSEEPGWAKIALASFYVFNPTHNTEYYRPQETRRILEDVIQGDYSSRDKALAAERLEYFQKSGILK